MTHSERVLKTLNFKETDRVPCDLMEGSVWKELMNYFRDKYGFNDVIQILNFLDTDFRWIYTRYEGPKPSISVTEKDHVIYSNPVAEGPLATARTIADIEAYDFPDPLWWQIPDFADFRNKWQDYAIVFLPGWMPLFWSSCLAFGMEGALVKMVEEPKIYEAFVMRQHEFYMDILTRGVKAGRGICDICWLGDDFSSQKAMLMNPDLWRKYIKPYLAEQVQLARDNDMFVFYHSCGSVRQILPDLIDMGVNALLVFQTKSTGMDVQSVVRDFGGKLAFYGGIDIQQILSYGTPDDVVSEVRKNIEAFENYGGYIVANSHHGVSTIKGENIEAMFQAVRMEENSE
ncbi:hypothetical protein GF312_01030 [Candidatus Poribacteria bacterium]|nr:hypothetical protein [Candidatus Poribacteria bacterium]